MPTYSAHPVNFGQVLFLRSTLEYMWDRRRTCDDFFTDALLARGLPVTVVEARWWLDRFDMRPQDSMTFDEFVNEFFWPVWTAKPNARWKAGSVYFNAGAYVVSPKVQTGPYDAGDTWRGFQQSPPENWAQDWFLLKINPDDINRSLVKSNRRADSNIHDQATRAYSGPEWTQKVDNVFARLLQTTCDEDYIHAIFDIGELKFSPIRPFMAPEKFGTIGLTENPWGLPISLMQWMDRHNRNWPEIMRGHLDYFLSRADTPWDLDDIVSTFVTDEQLQKNKRLTMAYAEAFKKTAAEIAPNDEQLKITAENYWRFAKNIATVNKKLRDAQDKAFTSSIVSMVAGAALGFGISQVFGPYLSTLSTAAGQAVGSIGQFVTQQVGNFALKQASNALLGAVVSVPEFDPPKLLAMLPMPDAPTNISQVSISREKSVDANNTAKEALALAKMGAPTAAHVLTSALEKSKSAMAEFAESRDETAYQILLQTKNVMQETNSLLSGLPFIAPQLPEVLPQVDSGGAIVNIENPPVVAAGAGGTQKSNGLILGLLALGFALAIPIKKGKK